MAFGFGPHQDTMDRIKANYAALTTPDYRATRQGRGRMNGHKQWQKDHAEAVDASRGAKKRGNLDTQQMAERRDSQVVIGWGNLRQVPRPPHHG